MNKHLIVMARPLEKITAGTFWEKRIDYLTRMTTVQENCIPAFKDLLGGIVEKPVGGCTILEQTYSRFPTTENCEGEQIFCFLPEKVFGSLLTVAETLTNFPELDHISFSKTSPQFCASKELNATTLFFRVGGNKFGKQDETQSFYGSATVCSTVAENAWKVFEYVSFHRLFFCEENKSVLFITPDACVAIENGETVFAFCKAEHVRFLQL